MGTTGLVRSTGSARETDRASMWWLLALAALLAAVVATSCGDDETDQVATATELADTWVQAWNENDPEMVGSVFSEDGVYDDHVIFDEADRTYTRDEAMDIVRGQGAMVVDVERTSDLAPTESGSFTFDCEFTVIGSARSAVVEIELDGDRASRIEFLSSEILEP
jgi:hypothetical protein